MFLSQHHHGGGAQDGEPLAPGFSPTATVIHDQQHASPGCLQLEGQRDAAALPWIDAGVQRFITALTRGKRCSGGAGEPATGDGEILLKILRSAFHHRNLQGGEDLQKARQG